jgi:hypothetical protein
MKVYLATFYSADLKRSAERFKKQAELMSVYDDIFTNLLLEQVASRRSPLEHPQL